ncbi:MAG TPA: transporter substrate-binding domain-containing protein [Micropepsaceae bacterium]|jgi:polar amino acid transport system substrate-binding protein|nr:transporter substrate-binding domain-containing protein [Micropepsaceae bacterium]
MTRLFFTVLLCSIMTASSASSAPALPTGTLRATFIATNPVQGIVDAKTGAVKGPANDLTHELGRRLGVPVNVTPAKGVQGVLASVKNGEADIGFLAFDPTRAGEVDYSQIYSLAQNTFMVLAASPLKSSGEIDRAGLRIGVTEGDTGALYLGRTLKNATLTPNKDGNMDAALKMLRGGEIDAYGTNRQRLYELAQGNPGFRLLPDNFYGVPQAIIVKKGNAALLAEANRMLDEARKSGLIAAAIRDTGLVGVDVAPPRESK